MGFTIYQIYFYLTLDLKISCKCDAKKKKKNTFTDILEVIRSSPIVITG